ncbi:hypothetical protein BDY24DRAFT_370495 [Mrakia frigida]|uniref:LysM peptidoglycan-binding domain-containing protein n=1 Tax=Mrakia frigida TaxID=29902 RepID=UPI003FCBF484
MSWPSSSSSSSSASTSSRTPFPPLSPTRTSNGAGFNSSTASSSLSNNPSSSSSPSSPETISRRRSVKAPHPLSSINTRTDSDQDDATRPKLTRRTTETREELERVGRSSESSDGGLRQSLELLRKGKANIDGGVDVLVHEVQPTDTLAKVALLYGIELSILRKSNKLWSSDTIHLRRTLYVPLEACRLRETVVHGPGPDQVTLVSTNSKPPPAINGRRSSAHLRSRTTAEGSSETGGGGGWNTPSLPGSRRGSTAGSEGGSSRGLGGEWDEEGFVAKRFLGGTSMIYSSSEVDDAGAINLTSSSSSSLSSSPAQGGSSSARYTPSSSFPASSPPPLLSPIPTSFIIPSSSNPTSAAPPPSNERILSLLRIPASELSFFPKSTTTAPSRSSLDSRLPPIPSSSYSSSPKSPNGGPSSFRTSSTTTISRSSTASRPAQQQHLLNSKRSSPSLSLSSRLTSLFVLGDPFPTPVLSISPSSSISTLRPPFHPRARSASSSANLYPSSTTSSTASSSSTNPPLSVSTNDPAFELTPTSSRVGSPSPTSATTTTRRTDWFAQPEPIRKQLEPAKPMMVNGGGSGKGRRVGDGLGNGSDLGVLI